MLFISSAGDLMETGNSLNGEQRELNDKPQTRQARRLIGRRGRKKKPLDQRASINGHGGRYEPLTQTDMQSIHAAVLAILENVGMSDASKHVKDIVTKNGGYLKHGNRLCFPADLVNRALDALTRNFTLHGQTPGHELCLSEKRVHVGSGGAAPLIVDTHTGAYRPSTLVDLYDAARLVDALDNVHFFSRSLVACDMPSPSLLDTNTAYASLAGTAKHVMVSATNAENVSAIAHLCFSIAGSESAFIEKPFLSLNINHVVSPLRFSTDACEVLKTAALMGIPVQVNTFAQLGASSPVTIAGCVAQTLAETLAGMIYAWLVNPCVKAICGPRPMVTDLRTGSMAGGAGEQALLTAAAVQMSHFYELPNSTIAGATDSKISDVQSGYEKSLSVTLAAQAGSNLITQACGMQAGLMACSFEAYVADNEMLGSILRSLAPVEISTASLSVDMVTDVVNGDGHYLGHEETLKRMQTDFLYPTVADRRDHAAWAADGSPDLRSIANQRARRILSRHYPNHIPAQVDHSVRAAHDIRLPRVRMQAGAHCV